VGGAGCLDETQVHGGALEAGDGPDVARSQVEGAEVIGVGDGGAPHDDVAKDVEAGLAHVGAAPGVAHEGEELAQLHLAAAGGAHLGGDAAERGGRRRAGG
jgi:predicted urease superfamily metal-dependent hydrolase